MSDNIKKMFENYEEQPNPQLWDRIISDVKRHNAIKRARTITAVVAVLAGAVTTLLLINNNDKDEAKASQLAENNTTVVVNEAITTNANTVSASDVSEAAMPQVIKKNSSDIVTRTVANENDVAEKTVRANETANNASAETTERQNVQAAQAEVAANAAPVSAAVITTQQVAANTVQPVAENKTMMTENTSTSSSDDSGLTTSELKLDIPNAFAPDQAQYFRVGVHSSRYEWVNKFEMYIYSRNGMQVFHTKDIKEGWDGKYKGKILPFGAYAFMVKYTDDQAKEHVVRGTVTLVR